MISLVFWVEGIPVPKQRPRTVRVKGKTVTFTPRRTAKWEQIVRLIAQAACSSERWKPTPGSYEVDLTVHRARKSGDADNHAKSVGDALNGVAYPDDASVRKLHVRLIDDGARGVLVRVTKTPAEPEVSRRGRQAP